MFLLLTRDCVRAHKISGHNKNAQFGGLLFSLDLVLVTDVRYVERRGYLTLCVEGQVSWDWRTLDHVTSILTSDWSRAWPGPTCGARRASRSGGR